MAGFEKIKKILKGEIKNPFLKTLWELLYTFLAAAFIYYVVLSSLLSTSSPLVTVTSCSMWPFFNIGDMVLLKGASFEEIRAPLFNASGDGEVEFRGVFKDSGMTGLEISSETLSETYVLNETGDIVVYSSPFRLGEPVIHRVLLKVESDEGRFLITKGDNNPTFDQDCGRGFECVSPPVEPEWVSGKVLFKIPLIGHVKMFLTLSYGYGFSCGRWIWLI